MKFQSLKNVFGGYSIMLSILGIGLSDHLFLIPINFILRLLNILLHVNWIHISFHVQDYNLKSPTEIEWIINLTMAILCFLWYLYKRKDIEKCLLQIINLLPDFKIAKLHRFTRKVGILFVLQFIYFVTYDTSFLLTCRCTSEFYFFVPSNFSDPYYHEMKFISAILESMTMLYVYGTYLTMALLYMIAIHISTELKTDYYSYLRLLNFGSIGKSKNYVLIL